jgi:uncharacterized membrane protein YhaH (DUF805 family)
VVEADFLKMSGSFNRVQYFASLFMAAFTWGIMELIFAGPAKEQFSESLVLPQAITITPPLLVFLFAAVKRFRHLGASWWIRILFLSAVTVLAVSDLVWLDFAERYRFYHRVLAAFWVSGTVLLLVLPGPGDTTPGFGGD